MCGCSVSFGQRDTGLRSDGWAMSSTQEIKRLFLQGEVRNALSTTLQPQAVFEVRALNAKLSGSYRTGVVSGYFDNADACITELQRLTTAKGIYVTLNPVGRALLARRANRLDYADKNA